MPFIEKEIWAIHKNNPNFLLIGLAKDTEQRPQREKEIEIMTQKTGVTYPIITDYKSKIFELHLGICNLPGKCTGVPEQGSR